MRALVLTASRLGFDYGCLLCALRATGSHARPSLVLLAYAATGIVALVPITPGGLGIVEASLSGLLVLAGVPGGKALVATLAYRLASYWLPLLAGLVAYLLFRRRYPPVETAGPNPGGRLVRTEVSELPSSDGGVVVEPLATVPNVRRAADVLRLILALAVLLLRPAGGDPGAPGGAQTERGLLDTIVTLPASLRDSLTAAVQLVAVVMPAAVVVAMAVRRRFATVGKLVVAGAVGMLAGVFVSHLWLGSSHPPTWHELLTGRNGIVAVTVPPVAWLAGTTAVVTVAGAELSRRWRRALWWLTGIAAALEVIVGGFLPVDAVVAAALGVSIGSSILLIFGEPARRPTAAQVVAALQECGVEVASLKQLPPAGKGPDMFRATTGEGTGLAVRVYAADDRDRDRLARLTRWLLVRDPQDDRAGPTVESAAEHEMLAMVAAARAGGASPNPSSPTPSPAGQGRRGPWWPGSTWAANAGPGLARTSHATPRWPICGRACPAFTSIASPTANSAPATSPSTARIGPG